MKPLGIGIVAAAAVCAVAAVCFIAFREPAAAPEVSPAAGSTAEASSCEDLIVSMIDSDGADAEAAQDALVDSLLDRPGDTLEALGAREEGTRDWLCWTVASGLKDKGLDGADALSAAGLSQNAQDAAALISRYLSQELPAPEHWRQVYLRFWDKTLPGLLNGRKVTAIGLSDSHSNGVPDLIVWQEGAEDGVLYCTDGNTTYHNAGNIYEGAPPDDAGAVLRAESGTELSRDQVNAFLNAWRPAAS